MHDADDDCFDDNDEPIACEVLDGGSELADDSPSDDNPSDDNLGDDVVGGADAAADYAPGPDDLDGPADEAIDELPDGYATLPHMATPDPALDWGRTNTAERRELLPIGRSAGVSRFVVMRLRPTDLHVSTSATCCARPPSCR